MSQIREILSNWENQQDWLIHDTDGNLIPQNILKKKWQGLRSAIKQHSRGEKPIVVCLEHNESFVLTILACLAEGVPFIPSLPSWPTSRFEQLVNFVDPALTVNLANFELLCSYSPVQIDEKKIQSDTAYIMFTSGTTGTPKGVCISRKALGSFWFWLSQYFQAIPSKIHQLLVTQFTFDISLLDLGLFLIKNSHLFFSQFKGNPFSLGAELEKWKIETLNTVPNNITSFVAAEMHLRCDLSLLKFLFIGGAKFSEATYSGISQPWCSKARVFNFYGPTEATIYSHVHEITRIRENDWSGNHITVGRPIPGMSHAIKDPTGQRLLPAGRTGEVVLGGIQLMDRYLKNPASTESAIVELNGTRFYKTGDLGFIDNEGQLYILGRIDETVKRRGFRVNLLDIDAYIQQISGVLDCITLAFPDETLENWLLTVIISDSHTEEERLQTEMKSRLLEHQIPDAITFTEKFPVNTSGKVDRKTLMEQFSDLHPASL